MDDTQPKRDFKLDKQTNDYHCMYCILAIEDSLRDAESTDRIPYWKRHKRVPPADSRRQPKKDVNLLPLDELLKSDGEIPLLDEQFTEIMEDDEDFS